MQPISPTATTLTEQTNSDKLRAEARRFIDALTDRLAELENLAQLAHRFKVFSTSEYTKFKDLFLTFRDLSDEFQVLSRLAENSLAAIDHSDKLVHDDAVELATRFREMQIPMLRSMIDTNLRLVTVWDDRLRAGQGLPYGTRELFGETVRIIEMARTELLRPRYLALLEADAVEDAERAERLLRNLIKRAPRLFDFVESETLDEELMRLIKGLPRRN